jgi:oligoendopeptidase F
MTLLVPEKIVIEEWTDLQPLYEKLLDFSFSTYQDFEVWLKSVDLLFSFIDEEHAWRYIRKSLDTNDVKAAASFDFFLNEILPQVQVQKNKINQKYYDSPFRKSIPNTLKNYDRTVEKDIKLFREANVELETKCSELAAKYMEISGKTTIEWEGKTITPRQASGYLQELNRDVRQAVWTRLAERRLNDYDEINDIFDRLVLTRHEISNNAGFNTYTDYIYLSLGRFDYGRKECEEFHAAVETVVKPLWLEILANRRQKLGLDSLRPWDLDVDEKSRFPLSPFGSGDELIDKTLSLFKAMDEQFYGFAYKMKTDNLLDVSSRVGKAPGGFNYPLAVTGAPFIFMNAAEMHHDILVITHELGHAFHTFLSFQLPYRFQAEVPSEVAELASMSMELFASDYWNSFYSSEEDIRGALYEGLTGIVRTLIWTACVDAFQHWVYDNPFHNREAREKAWTAILLRFQGEPLDWTGLENFRKGSWQRQLHIFEVPFYYIEYGIAQLGALQLWKNFKSNPKQTLYQYKQALALGYTRTIPEIYQAAGIKFDFSPNSVKEVFDFLKFEIAKLEDA